MQPFLLLTWERHGTSITSAWDAITIEEFKPKHRPKVVLTWAPHPKALPQAVAN
jgi:N-succinyl-L-ornithine transcarbamylase